MATLNLSQAVQNSFAVGDVSLPLIAELPGKFGINPLKRSNRVNVRLRDNDIELLESLALEAGMPFHAFLAELIHKYASGNLKENLK